MKYALFLSAIITSQSWAQEVLWFTDANIKSFYEALRGHYSLIKNMSAKSCPLGVEVADVETDYFEFWENNQLSLVLSPDSDHSDLYLREPIDENSKIVKVWMDTTWQKRVKSKDGSYNNDKNNFEIVFVRKHEAESVFVEQSYAFSLPGDQKISTLFTVKSRLEKKLSWLPLPVDKSTKNCYYIRSLK